MMNGVPESVYYRYNLEDVANIVNNFRRAVNKNVALAIANEITGELVNAEDQFRLIGNLNALYEHCMTVRAIGVSDIKPEHALFCIVKHLSTAIVQAEEANYNTSDLYEALKVLTNNAIAPCQACIDDMPSNIVYNGVEDIIADDEDDDVD